MARKYQLHGAFPSKAGDSAFQVAQKNGFEGTEQEWLNSLVGPQGEPGKDADPSKFIEIPEATSVGQTIVVKEVDENGKPTVWEAADFPSGGGGERWEELINVTVEEEVSKVETTLDNPGKFKTISVYLDLRNVPTNEKRIVTVDINNPYKWTPNPEYTLCNVPRFGETNQTDMKYVGAVLFTPSHVLSQGYSKTLNTHVYDGNSNITVDTVASTIAVTTQNNDTVFGVGSIIKVYGVRA
jgi:hypothetical protein